MTLRDHPDVPVHASRVVYHGDVFDLVERRQSLPSGLELDFALVEHPGAVGIAALDDEGRLLAVRQYRPAASDWTVEIPAGRLDPGEDPLEAARRELEEETGFRARRWRSLLAFLPAPGFCSEVLHLFEARELEEVEGGGRACDDDEELDVQHRTPEELLRLAVLDAKTVIAAQAVLLARRRPGARSRPGRG